MASTPPPAAGPQPETPPAADNDATTSTSFFTWMRGLGIRRQDGWIGGVAGGLATRMGIDPLIVRGILVVLAIFGAPVILLYAAAWLLLPDLGDKIHLEEAIRGRFEAPLAGIAVAIIIAIAPFGQGVWAPGITMWSDGFWSGAVPRGIWTLVLLGALVWFLIWISQRNRATPGIPTAPTTASAAPDSAAFVAPSPEPPAPPTGSQPEDVAAWRASQAEWKAQHDTWRNQQASAAHEAARAKARAAAEERNRAYREERERSEPNHLVSFVVVGLAIIAGAVTVLALGGGETFDGGMIRAGLAAALGVLALGVLVNGAIGKRSGGPGGFAVPVVVAIVLSFGIPTLPLGAQVAAGGAVHYSPSDGSEKRTVDSYFVGGGSTTIDLTDYYDSGSPMLAAGERRDLDDAVNLVMGGGSAYIILPDDERVTLRTTMAGGTMTIEGDDVDGYNGPRTVRQTFLPDGETATDEDAYARTIDVTVTMGGGSITVVRDSSTKDEN